MESVFAAMLLAIEVKRAQAAWAEQGVDGYERLAADDVESGADEVSGARGGGLGWVQVGRAGWVGRFWA